MQLSGLQFMLKLSCPCLQAAGGSSAHPCGVFGSSQLCPGSARRRAAVAVRAGCVCMRCTKKLHCPGTLFHTQLAAVEPGRVQTGRSKQLGVWARQGSARSSCRCGHSQQCRHCSMHAVDRTCGRPAGGGCAAAVRASATKPPPPGGRSVCQQRSQAAHPAAMAGGTVCRSAAGSSWPRPM